MGDNLVALRPRKHSMVVQSNELVRSVQNYTLNEKRLLVFIAASLPHSEDIDLEKSFAVQFSASDYQEVFRNHHSLSGNIWNVIRSVGAKGAYFENEEGGRTNLFFFQRVECSPDKKDFKLFFHPDSLKYLVNLRDNFTQYKIGFVSGMRSVYSIRLYELMSQHKNIGHRKFSIEDFKEILGVTSSAYERFNNLFQRIINPAIKEIGEKAGMVLECERIKDGRKVIHLNFKIKKTSHVDVPDICFPPQKPQKKKKANRKPTDFVFTVRERDGSLGMATLLEKDFILWKETYKYIDVSAELRSLADWSTAGQLKRTDWFFRVSGALKNRNNKEQKNHVIKDAYRTKQTDMRDTEEYKLFQEMQSQMS